MSVTRPNTNAGQPFTSILVAEDNDPNRPGLGVYYCSITASPEHRDLSPDELRLHDYCRQKTPIITVDKSRKLPGALELSVRSPTLGTAKYRGSAITFLVGTHNAESFTIHESIIAGQSEFVRLALKGSWQEAKSREIPLPDDDPRTFEIYQGWLYDRQVYTDHWIGSSESTDEPDRLMQAWILGDKFLDTDFKDAVMDALVARLRDTEAFETLRALTEFIYTKTPEGSAPRRLLIDIFTSLGNSSWLDELSTESNAAYAVDLLKDLGKKQYAYRHSVGLLWPAYKKVEASCTYHDHEQGKCFRAKLLD